MQKLETPSRRLETAPTSSNNALRNKSLGFVPLPIPNPADKEHYLSPEETGSHIVNNSVSFEAQQKFLPPLHEASSEKGKLLKDKNKDKDNSKVYKGSKARDVINCANCLAPRVAHSMYEPGSALGGPKKRHVDKLQQYKEKGEYVCGDRVPVSRYYTKLSL